MPIQLLSQFMATSKGQPKDLTQLEKVRKATIPYWFLLAKRNYFTTPGSGQVQLIQPTGLLISLKRSKSACLKTLQKYFSGPTAVSFQGNYLICWNLSIGITLLK